MKSNFVRESSYQKLSPPFREVIDNYKMAASKTEKRDTTIQSEANNGAAFLLCLQKQGAKSLVDVTDVMVQKFFFDGEKQLSNVQKITSAENLRSRASDEIVPFREFIIKDDTSALL